MLENGYVMLHRSMLKWEWYKVPNTRIVFEHLILTANWEDTKWHGITIKRGQRICSVATLADETGLSVKNVRTAIKHLKSTNDVAIDVANGNVPKSTVFTVIGYDKFQKVANETANDVADRWQIDGKSSANRWQQFNKDNKDNNNNNAKKDSACAGTSANPTDRQKVCFSENVFLTEAQHSLLLRDHGQEDTQKLIELLDRYKAETGTVYNSDYHAIKKWVANKLSEEREKRAEENHSSFCNFSLDDFTEKPG